MMSTCCTMLYYHAAQEDIRAIPLKHLGPKLAEEAALPITENTTIGKVAAEQPRHVHVRHQPV